MHFKPFFLSVVLFVITFSFSNAQNVPDYSVRGIVVDSTDQKPMSLITVSLKNDAKQAIKAAVTKGDGSFIFEKLPAGNYSVTLVSLGYRSKTVPVTLSSDVKQLDLGSIALSVQSNQLDAVSITVEKPIIKQEIDKITYDLQTDPESKSNSVLEMMRKVPLLSLDAEDNIQLKGSGNYKILINGKPSSMVDQNPKDILRSMPASSIQNIEVITNPPSKYEAEGLAGIINIITNKKVDNGYNGNININHRFPVGGPGAGGSFTVKSGKFGTSGYGGIGTYNSPSVSSYNTRNSTSSNLQQNFNRTFDQTWGYFGTELSFEIDTLNLITGQFGIDGGIFRSTNNQSSTEHKNNVLSQQYKLINEGDNSNHGINGSINYQKGFKSNKNRLLTFSYRYTGYINEQLNAISATERMSYTNADFNQKNNGSSEDHTIQADYVHPLKKITVEAGVKSILRLNQSEFKYDTLANGVFVRDMVRSNSYNNEQDIYGIYNSYTYNLKDWGFKGGVRLEQTMVDADFVSAGQVEKNYLNLIPSISINRKFKNQSSLNLGYTQRIQRPGIWQLNPFVDESNSNFINKGNPDLHAVVANNFQLSYSKFKKGSVNIGIGYTTTDDNIQRVTELVGNKSVSTFQNVGTDRRLSTNINVNYPITKKWNLNMSGNLYYVWIQGRIGTETVSNDGLAGYFYAGTGYRLDNGWRFNANFNYNSPFINLQGQSNAYINSSFSINRDIVKDKLSFSVSSNNPFSKFRTYINRTQGLGFSQESSGQNYYRAYSLSLNYRFGKLKEAIKKNKRGINNDDVTSGSGPQ